MRVDGGYHLVLLPIENHRTHGHGLSGAAEEERSTVLSPRLSSCHHGGVLVYRRKMGRRWIRSVCYAPRSLYVQGKVSGFKQWQAAWAKRASNRRPQAEFVPSDSPWGRPCFNSDTLLCNVFNFVQFSGLEFVGSFFQIYNSSWVNHFFEKYFTFVQQFSWSFKKKCFYFYSLVYTFKLKYFNEHFFEIEIRNCLSISNNFSVTLVRFLQLVTVTKSALKNCIN